MRYDCCDTVRDDFEERDENWFERAIDNKNNISLEEYLKRHSLDTFREDLEKYVQKRIKKEFEKYAYDLNILIDKFLEDCDKDFQ